MCIAEAPVSPGCSALTGWDGTQNTAAIGAVVWRELWPRLGPVRHLRLAQRLAPTTLAWQRDRAVTVGG